MGLCAGHWHQYQEGSMHKGGTGTHAGTSQVLRNNPLGLGRAKPLLQVLVPGRHCQHSMLLSAQQACSQPPANTAVKNADRKRYAASPEPWCALKVKQAPTAMHASRPHSTIHLSITSLAEVLCGACG
jgi:hypothetical protein